MRFLEILPPKGSGRSRSLALALLGLAFLLIGRGVVMPLVHSVNGGGPIAERKSELAANRRLASHRDQLEKTLAELNQKQGDRGDFIQGATPALAEAELQSRIGTILHDAGGVAASSEALPPSKAAEFSQIGVRFRFNANPHMLRKILYDIESGRPRLTVDSLAIHRGAKDDDLSVIMAVTGYLTEHAP